MLIMNSMTVPPNALAALSIALAVWVSTHYNRRAPVILVAASLAIIGMPVLPADLSLG